MFASVLSESLLTDSAPVVPTEPETLPLIDDASIDIIHLLVMIPYTEPGEAQ
jgi:hypothetical protein